MDERPKKRRGPMTLLVASRHFRCWIAGFAMLPLIYVASFGPACRSVKISDRQNVDRLTDFYAPLLRLAISSGWLWTYDAAEWYGGYTGAWVLETRRIYDIDDVFRDEFITNRRK